jgi:membrane-associated phospholipid phosphatase
MTATTTSTSNPTIARRRASLVLVSVTSVMLLAVLYAVAVHTEVGQRLDDAALRGRTRDSAVQHAVGRALDTVSTTSLVIATVALVVVALARRRPRLAVGVGVLVVGANVTTQILKEVLDRPRLGDSAVSSVTSFPSGHSTVAMSLALALVVVVPSRHRLVAGVAGVTYAVVVGAATLTGAWHRTSDVLGAYLVTLAWAAGVCAWLVAARRARRVTAPRGAVAFDVMLPVLSVLFVAAAVAVGVDVVHDATANGVSVGRAYLVALVTIVAGAVATLGALLAALGRASLDPRPQVARV